MKRKKNTAINLDEYIVNKIKDVINKSIPESEIILYGSRAKGTAKSHSDWDLLILLNLKKITFDLERKIMNRLYEIEIDTGEIITPLIYTKNEWIRKHAITPLFENIRKEGIRIK